MFKKERFLICNDCGVSLHHKAKHIDSNDDKTSIRIVYKCLKCAWEVTLMEDYKVIK